MLEHRRITESLDQQLLARTEPPSHADAATLLKRKKIICNRVVAVDVDAVLFLDGGKRPMTAWLRWENGATRLWLEAGFPAERGYEENT